mgnify:CR=1 FL=1
MITALDHIAIAVPDLEKAIQRFVTDFGLPLGGREDVKEAKTTAAFLPLPPTNIELVYPLNGEGPVATYLEKKGGGLHHLCFRSDDIDADVARLRDKGYQFLADAVRPREKVGMGGPSLSYGPLKQCQIVFMSNKEGHVSGLKRL